MKQVLAKLHNVHVSHTVICFPFNFFRNDKSRDLLNHIYGTFQDKITRVKTDEAINYIFSSI